MDLSNLEMIGLNVQGNGASKQVNYSFRAAPGHDIKTLWEGHRSELLGMKAVSGFALEDEGDVNTSVSTRTVTVALRFKSTAPAAVAASPAQTAAMPRPVPPVRSPIPAFPAPFTPQGM